MEQPRRFFSWLWHSSCRKNKELVTISRLFGFETFILRVAIIFLLASGLDGYNLGFVPLPWISQVGFIAAALFILAAGRILPVPGAKTFLGVILWAVLITLFNTITFDYASLMPLMATTPYLAFITLRFLTFASFIATLEVIYWLLMRGYREDMARWIIYIGTLLSVTALYIYVAQTYNLPYPHGNRMGTGGGEQPIIFSYAFHRAIGTFREPSFLAEWLIVPFFMSFYGNGGLNWRTLLIGSVLLLTGSMTGILGGGIGFAAALVLTNPFRSKKRITLRLAVVALAGLALFNFLAVGYENQRANLLQVIAERSLPILSGGLSHSNRAYIIDYVQEHPFPLFGLGLGNANLVFSASLGGELTGGFLSLYYNILYSLGIFGFSLLLFFMLLPVLRLRRSDAKSVMPILAGYIAWLVMFSVNAEELNVMFAVAYAFLIYETRQVMASDHVRI